MTEAELRELLPALESFHARFHGFFHRSESRSWALKYLIGLLLDMGRKNVENISEQVGGAARRLQQFITDSPWEDEGCIEELQQFAGESLGSANGVMILDDTGFAKQGRHSAGVGRQYSGTLGRVDNCQVGVFLGYASAYGHTLVDRRLYLKEDWFGADAASRRKRSGVPEELCFQTKLSLGMQMWRTAHQRGHLPYQWVTGDGAYGECHDLRGAIAQADKWYCFEVRSTAEVWQTDPGWKVPPRKPGRGATPKYPRPTPASPPAMTVAELTASLPAQAWVRHRVCEGAKGPREYEFARVRVVEKQHQRPASQGWMMARRRVGRVSRQTAEETEGDERKTKYYLSNAPETVALAEMAWVGSLRWTIEEDFALAKGETGLDEYEVTKLRGWYHHITLSLLALAFLKGVQRDWGKKRDTGYRAGDSDPHAVGASTRPVDTGQAYRMAARTATPKRKSQKGPSQAVAA